jgi:hypothetical protein
MKKQINWQKEYISVIQSHHKFNSPGISLEDFLLLSDKEKTKIISYYNKESLLSSITNKERVELESSVLPCASVELCDFLKTEKEEKLTPQDVRESLDKVLKELRELKELTKNISKLETESWKLKSLYIDLLEQEDKEIENKLWGNKMKTFKENILCQ